MEVVGLALSSVMPMWLHFQNCLTKGRLFQNHMPHLFFFLRFFLWSSQRWHSVFETLSSDLAFARGEENFVLFLMKTKTTLGKSGCTRKRLFSVLLGRCGEGYDSVLILSNFFSFPVNCVQHAAFWVFLITFCTGIYQKPAHSSFHSVYGEDNILSCFLRML